MCHMSATFEVPATRPTGGLRDRKRAEARARTVEVALELFAERGYDAVTVAEICEAADISPRTFFRYFLAKEDLLVEPARQMAARVSDAIVEAPEGLDDVTVLRHALRELGEFVVAQAEWMMAFADIVTEANVVLASPMMLVADREHAVLDDLVRRRGADAVADWQTKLLVAKTVSGFRVWMEEYREGGLRDPLGHLDEVLAAV
jgi:AcrR family transcriptional regulator